MTNRVTPPCIISLEKDEVFVFSSNITGHHAKGNAFRARSWGAKMGNGEGLQGQTYAIPVTFETAEEIRPYINEFITFAKQNPRQIFLVTEIACDMNEHFTFEIAPLFFQAITCENIYLPESFWKVLMKDLRGRVELVAYHRSCSFTALAAEMRDLTPEKFSRLIDAYEGALRFIKDLSNTFPEVNDVWLKTGKGDYLNRSKRVNSDSTIDDILAAL